jgi:plasmid stabilization system protein ParE
VARGGSPELRTMVRTKEVPVMPRSWSAKRERQYEHIKDSYEDRGVKADEAEERAARTVNKERAEHGETKSSKKR